MRVADIQRFCMHDGPGIRTTVFLKGCPLRCAWCHNPETQSPHPQLLFYGTKCIGCGECAVCEQGGHLFDEGHRLDRQRCVSCGDCTAACPTGALELIGRDYTPEALWETIRKDAAFYGDGGGVTLSGGEPFMQAEEALALLQLCKEKGLHTAVETCGCFPSAILPRAVRLTDLFLWDIKDTDEGRHRQYVGGESAAIRQNLLTADGLGAKTRLRCILVNGVNTNEAHYAALAALYEQLTHCEGMEFLPYHTYGGSKSAALDLPNSGRDEWIPSAEQVAAAKAFLTECGVPVL